MQRITRRFAVLAVGLAGLLAVHTPLRSAQTTPITQVYPYQTKNITWASNGDYLVFEDYSYETAVRLSEPGWYQYNPVSAQLTQSDTWPLLPALSVAQMTAFNPIIDNDNNPIFMSLSPDGNYLAYASPRGTQIYAPVNLGNLRTLQTVSTEIDALGISSGPEYFNVLWSADSSTFVFSATPIEGTEPQFFYHVSHYQNNLSKLGVKQIDAPIIDGETYSVLNVFSLSKDGSRVLMEGFHVPPNESKIAVWNSALPNAAKTVEGLTNTDVIGAAFCPDDENKILIVNQQGLLQYDLQEHTATLLRADVNSASFRKAVFSPDGRWLALLANDDGLFMLSVRDVLSPLTATDIP
jgi:WD40 repeat protein